MLPVLLRLAGALLCGALLHTAAAAQAGGDPAPLDVTEVATGVYVHAGVIEDWLPGNGGDIANLGFVVGSRCVAVIDTGGTPQLGLRWRAAIERTTRLPICFVFDTHAHPDHVLGNAAFAGPDTRVVASAKFNAAMSAREPYFLRALERDFGVSVAHEAMVYPTLAVDGTREFDLGDRVLVAADLADRAHRQRPDRLRPPHTHPVRVRPAVRAAHSGRRRQPARLADALPQLARIDAALIVPGHGPTARGGPDAWKPQQEYLEALLRETRAALKSHKTLSQAVDSVGTSAASRWQLAERFHRRNVTAAFAELEWED